MNTKNEKIQNAEPPKKRTWVKTLITTLIILLLAGVVRLCVSGMSNSNQDKSVPIGTPVPTINYEN
jgi:phosphatidylserine synthase